VTPILGERLYGLVRLRSLSPTGRATVAGRVQFPLGPRARKSGSVAVREGGSRRGRTGFTWAVPRLFVSAKFLGTSGEAAAGPGVQSVTSSASALACAPTDLHAHAALQWAEQPADLNPTTLQQMAGMKADPQNEGAPLPRLCAGAMQASNLFRLPTPPL
jgi:hypothetical protein